MTNLRHVRGSLRVGRAAAAVMFLLSTGQLPAVGRGTEGGLTASAATGDSAVEAWKPAAAPLMTRWAANVSPAAVLPEYPRPQLVRKEWMNLNGLWQLAEARDGEKPPVGKELTKRILVPFPVESALSGVMLPATRLWYRRTFEIPDEWRRKHVLLHFGAVDWETTVIVNGKTMVVHRGGYDPFSIDITSALKRGGMQELVVGVFDPTDSGDQPRGKQVRKPGGIRYTSTTGIWQTVWLEPVPAMYIAQLRLTPDAEAGTIGVEAFSSVGSAKIRVSVSDRGRTVVQEEGTAGSVMKIPLGDKHLWSPADPFLYDLRVELFNDRGVVDEVESYFGLRSVTMGSDGSGRQRISLNGQPLFLVAPLDQGFWPDGISTAPTDEALRFDIEETKRLGFNATRKHVKVEPERWYYWADRLGLLVWQDMPNGNNSTREAKQQFEHELDQLVRTHANHPSIIMWVVFNEGWGQFDTKRLTARVKRLDPTRLVNSASGWTDEGVGDINDIHSYPAPKVQPPDPDRVRVLGEFGGLGLAVEGHTWKKDHWGYLGVSDQEELTSRYERYLKRVHDFAADSGLAAAVYTQITDVEVECNGLLTYDREIVKPVADRIAAANRGDFSQMPPPPLVTPVVSTSESQGQSWLYTVDQPPASWCQPSFEASGWKSGVGGFGTEGTPGAIVRTEWNTPDIWMRRAFTIQDSVLPTWQFAMHHDEGAEVYLNGELVLQVPRYTVEYERYPLTTAARQLLRTGTNVIAVHCHQTKGGQYIDVGIIDVRPAR